MAQGNQSVSKIGKLSKARAREYSIVSDFKHGYRNREDITNLPPGVLVVGSQNVLTNVSDRIQVRQGFTLDGQSSTNTGGFNYSYDWNRHTGDEANLRAGALTTSNNGVNQVRYVATAGDYYNGTTFTEGQVYWIDIQSSLTSVSLQYSEFWDLTEKAGFLLWVDGTPNIYEWSGGVTTMLSATANTITKTGSTTWAQDGFHVAGTRKVTINGTEYTYTGGEGTTTLTGVSPSPVAEPVQSVVFQTVRVTANSAMTAIPATFNNAIIGNLENQIYVGSYTDSTVYVSKQYSYTDYSFDATNRKTGEGAFATLDSPPIGFVRQEQDMYITAGKEYWYKTSFVLSSDNVHQLFQILPLKTGSQQAAQSQSLISKMKNQVIFVSNEPTMDSLGRVEQILGTPQAMNMSDPIKLDFDSYDFTDGSVYYFRYFIYVAVPKEGLVRVFNLVKNYWEAPQILPVGKFATIGGELYGHGYGVAETYKMFSGYNDNGRSMEAIARFSFINAGTRTALKNQIEFYTEGYITSNTDITLGLQYDLDGCATNTEFTMNGNDGQFVCIGGLNEDDSLGKVSLGKRAFGGAGSFASSQNLPPKFRWIKTFPQTDFFEYQPTLSSIGIDQRWEILALGAGTQMSTNEPVKIKS